MGGQPKALMTLGGRPIIERVVAAVQGAVDDLLIVTNTPELYAFLGLPMVPDAFAEGGALGGIYSGLAAASGAAAFAVACDMPFVQPALVRLVVSRAPLGDVVIPRVGGQLETLHAVYARACLGPIEECLRAGRLKIAGFFDRVRVVEIAEEELARHADPRVAFMNVNTPDDYARARHLVEARP
jgi:molybdopterin-guanine dinucleotide biosynthesis protein A